MTDHALWLVTGALGVNYGLVIAFGPKDTKFLQDLAFGWLGGAAGVLHHLDCAVGDGRPLLSRWTLR